MNQINHVKNCGHIIRKVIIIHGGIKKDKFQEQIYIGKKYLGPVVRRPDSAIHWIVIF